MKTSDNRILILSGGTLRKEFLKQYSKEEQFDYIICVDGALTVVDQVGLTIDYLVGDFDSVSPELLQKYETMALQGQISTVIKKYIPEKDATDTQLAIELAMDLDAKEMVILGATGTRLDHVLGNLNLLMKPLSKGIMASIMDENNKIYFINKNTVIKKQTLYGGYISLLPFTEQVTNVTLTGFKYPLNRYLLQIGESIGISNELIEEEASIELEKGILIVVEAKD